MTNEERCALWERDPAHKAVSVVNMEECRYPIVGPRKHRVVVRLGKRKDAMALQAKIQEWLGTKNSP